MKAHSHEPMNHYEPRRMSRHYPPGVRLVLTGVSGKLGGSDFDGRVLGVRQGATDFPWIQNC
jgi:hypothetical protein